MPLQATSGAASYDAFGGGVAAVPNYIEDVFSTWLYTGNGSTQTINNGIDLAGKGGLVWVKGRGGSFGTGFHLLQDSARGFGNATALSSNSTGAQYSSTGIIQSVSSTGFTTGGSGLSNASDTTYASWTFREQPKFFDVVTYTGDGTNARSIAHNLGSTPGCIIVKRTNATGSWAVWHRATNGGTGNAFLWLDLTNAENTAGGAIWGDNTTNTYIAPTSTNFTVASAAQVNANGSTYVAYIFAHNAGGFGLSGTDNVISCGSFTASSGAATVDLGYEPQWILFKRTNGAEGWNLVDNMRGWSYSATALLQANTSGAEDPNGLTANPTATGFQFGTGTLAASGTYIYIAIRRGPMRTPTTGTSVFAPVAQNSAGTVTTNFPVDLMIGAPRASLHDTNAIDRLRGSSTTSFAQLRTNRDSAEATGTGNGIGLDNNTGYVDNFYSAGSATAYWNFRRAPGFFDVVCYTGNGASNRVLNHNLGVAPEMMIVKKRSSATQSDWVTQTAANSFATAGYLNSTDNFAYSASLYSPTATTFTASGDGRDNASGATYVAYLFASCPGVSKVFNYTGNGSSQTINCGFTGGARFVMIKRTDSTGDWYVWDTARGIVANNDPHLSLNSTSAEVTTNDTIDTDSTGFVVNQVSATNVNVNGASYIGLAIA